MPSPLSQRELDALRGRRRPLHRGARRGGVPSLRGTQGHVRPRADLRAPRRADEARHGPRHRRVGERRPQHRASSGSSPARATSATSSTASRRRSPSSRRDLKATVDGEEIPYRESPSRASANSEDRGRRERLERARNELTEEHLNPLYLRSTQVRAPRDRAPRRAELHGALPRLPVSARLARRPVPPFSRLDGASLGGRRRPLLPQPRRARSRRDRALGRRTRVARR